MRTAGILILILIWSPIFRSSTTSFILRNIYLNTFVSGDSSLAHFTRAAVGPAAYRPISKTFLITQVDLSQIPHKCPTVYFNDIISHLPDVFILLNERSTCLYSYFFLFMMR